MQQNVSDYVQNVKTPRQTIKKVPTSKVPSQITDNRTNVTHDASWPRIIDHDGEAQRLGSQENLVSTKSQAEQAQKAPGGI